MMGLLKWDERELYEKVIMAGLGAAIILALLFLIVVKPVMDAHKTAETEAAKSLRDYEIVSRAMPQLSQGPASMGAPFSRAALITAAQRQDIRLSRINPDASSLTVWIDDVETAKLYKLMNTLIVENGAELSRASITADNNGLLSAQLTLKTN
ncbi:type II secretion system protein GspM [Hellea balneolensis]|uniref:type II secretion system protein GspM n=1 Tax=Hellea balneolensis TaxID=287478 RepID=UPI0004120819|nr:type II secretion system protein GspM [Hellea balneolensis]